LNIMPGADTATKETVRERKVDGHVVIGAIGGGSVGATRGLAKELAKAAKEKFF